MGLHADDNRSYQDLDPSEAAILQVASRFFAGWLQAGRVDDDNTEALMDRAVTLAIRLADKVDARVQSENEL